MTVNECVVGETGHFLVVGEVSGWEDAALPTGTFFFLHVPVSSYLFFSFGKKYFICILPIFTCLAYFLSMVLKAKDMSYLEKLAFQNSRSDCDINVTKVIMLSDYEI